MDALIEALRASLDDARLSRGERKALQALVAARGLDPHARGVLRAEAFALAREALDGPAVGEVLGWLQDVMGVLVPTEAAPGGEADAVEHAAWFSPGRDPLLAILRELRAVRRSADICVFTITDDRISDGLLAVARRGVRVRVISDDGKRGDEGSDIDRLPGAGIEVRLDDTPAHMHHKYAVFDGARLLTGSFNWTRSATDGNHENLLLTTEPTLVRAYAAEFGRLWSRYPGGPA